MTVIKAKTAIPAVLPYAASIYYTDILFMLPAAVYLTGKIPAGLCALLLMILWTVHVIGLYRRKEINRKIHLWITTLDLAVRIPLAVNFLFFTDEAAAGDTALFIIHCAVICTAFPVLYFLTDEKVKASYV